jgi:alkyl hydroperoxide reductase subunit AhpC
VAPGPARHASFGVAVAQPRDGVSSLIGRADAALYAAKKAGRNQVVGAGSGVAALACAAPARRAPGSTRAAQNAHTAAPHSHPRSSPCPCASTTPPPDFEAETTQGKIRFHEWIGDQWAILFSHPKDFTPVCTTELGYMARIEPEFTKRNAKLIGLSVDPVDRHSAWAKDIEETQGAAVKYPMIGDADLKVAKLYNMLPAEEVGADGRTAANNATVRSVFIIGPDKKIKLMLTYPMTTGRNFDEILRVLDSMQLTAQHKVATPVNWKHGDDVIIVPAVSDDEARQKYPEGFKTIKPYLRTVRQPT